MGIVNGVRQWVFQRVANVFLVVFGAFLIMTFAKGLSYESLVSLTSSSGFKMFALVTLILGSLNAILAGWQIVGDYATKFGLSDKLLMTIVVAGTVVGFVAGLGFIF